MKVVLVLKTVRAMIGLSGCHMLEYDPKFTENNRVKTDFKVPMELFFFRAV